MGPPSAFAAPLAGTVALITLGAACAPVPPERNPPPAFAAPATIHLMAEAGSAEAVIADIVVRRLNESRGPDERPVRLVTGTTPSGGAVVVTTGALDAPDRLRVAPWSGGLGPSRRVDPEFPPSLLIESPGPALALYDAVAVAGLLARGAATLDGGLDRLRAQPPLDLAAGRASYATTLAPPGAPAVLVPGR